MKNNMPKYYRVAADLAARIVTGEYSEGQVISARSSIAPNYGVSSETARRAVALLSENGVVDIAASSGVIIRSKKNAAYFLNKYHDLSDISELQDELGEKFQRLKKDMEEFSKAYEALMERSSRPERGDTLSPYSAVVDERCSLIGKTYAEADFRHLTGATIVALKRGGESIISPGAGEIFLVRDTIYYVGQDDCVEKVRKLLNGK